MNDFYIPDEDEDLLDSSALDSSSDYGSDDGLDGLFGGSSAYSGLDPSADRASLISSLQGQLAGSDSLIKRGQLSVYGDDDLPKNKGSLAASALFGLLPIALGAAFAGSEGAAMGSQAGIAGATPFLRKMEEDEKKDDALGASMIKEGYARRGEAEKAIATLKRDEFKENAANQRSSDSLQRQKDIIDYAASKRGKGGSSSIAAGDAGRTQSERDRNKILDLQEKEKLGSLLPREKAELDLIRAEASKGGPSGYISRMSADGMKEIRGAPSKIRNLSSLAELAGADLNTDVADDIAKELKSQSAANPDGEFRSAGFISDILAKYNLNPNSTTGKYYIRAFEVARENAVAQAGVATNQDVEQEFAALQPRKLESSANFQDRLKNQIARQKKKLANAIQTEVDDNRDNAMNSYRTLKKDGFLPDDFNLEDENAVGATNVDDNSIEAQAQGMLPKGVTMKPGSLRRKQP